MSLLSPVAAQSKTKQFKTYCPETTYVGIQLRPISDRAITQNRQKVFVTHIASYFPRVYTIKYTYHENHGVAS